MRATRTIPETYYKAGTIDVSKDQRLLLILNLVAVVILGLAGWLFFRAAIWLRPDARFGGVFQIRGSTLVVLVGWVLGLTVLHIIAHEAVHGLFFWLFTGSSPRFAFRWAYAYAAAPDWYLPRAQFLVTTLAPLIVLSLLGLVGFRFAPPGWLLPIWYVAAMNAAGSVGDLMVALWLLRRPSTSLVQDRGDAITLFLCR